MAAQALQKLGYSAHNLGGFANWVQGGGAVAKV
jgi:rhodanese-related sulfurtransferase